MVAVYVPTSLRRLTNGQGKVEVDPLSASAVRHYEEEGAKFVKAPDGTAREVRIVATGVELTRPQLH